MLKIMTDKVDDLLWSEFVFIEIKRKVTLDLIYKFRILIETLQETLWFMC
jgi:hypothetical protein